MTKKEAKMKIKKQCGITVRGRCQINYHGLGNYSLSWGVDPTNALRFAHTVDIISDGE